MLRNLPLAIILLCSSCSTTLGDLDDLSEDVDACDPRGTAELGTDFDIQFVGLTPHVNQDMLFAVTVGSDHKVQSMAVLSAFVDPNMRLQIPKFLPAGPSELSFWADGNTIGQFEEINENGAPIDHQWTRPICPNGQMTFTHTTPFQDIQEAVATGAVFRFVIPPAMRRQALFDKFSMWVRAIKLSDIDASQEEQTLAYFRWIPLVDVARSEQRPPPEVFQVGGNVLGQRLGPIDQLSLYRIEFVIDVDESDDLSGGDFVCSFERQRAPDGVRWDFELDLDQCDPPNGFDPLTFSRN